MMNEIAFYTELGKNIKRLRISRGQRQQDLAGLLGLARTTITAIENGTQKIPIHLLLQITDALETEINAILPNTANLDRSEQILPPVTAQFVEELSNKLTEKK